VDNNANLAWTLWLQLLADFRKFHSLATKGRREMVTSMTGFGRGEATAHGITASVELRSVNSRFLEVSSRLPRSLNLREGEIKEILRRQVVRGKISVVVSIERNNGEAVALRINPATARNYYRLLADLKKSLRLRETIKLEHLLQFSDIMEQEEGASADDAEWEVVRGALDAALVGFQQMRRQEGGELAADFRSRIGLLQKGLDEVEQLSRTQVPRERERLRERIKLLIEDEKIDEGRLELEIALLADRLDVTEECVRFRSHNKFFLEALKGDEAAGRRLNFLVQEMNREVNTIGSKSNAQEIAHLVVGMKEELEKIREQLQNIE
jgi:uncharacterized protein (TIGR00255 family)